MLLNEWIKQATSSFRKVRFVNIMYQKSINMIKGVKSQDRASRSEIITFRAVFGKTNRCPAMLGMTLYKFLLSIRIIYEIAKLVSVHAREKQL